MEKKSVALFVIVGHWNPSIFDSDWVKEYLFPEEDFSVELSVEKHYAVKIETKSIQIHINEVLFKVSVLIPQDEKLMTECQEIVFKMCGYLSHTPVKAMGVNFLYEYTPEKFGKNMEVFSSPDKNNIEKLGYKNCINYKVSRTYKTDKKDFNMFMELLEDKNVKVAFNHHYQLNKLNDIKVILNETDVTELYKETLSFVNEVYSL